MKTTPLKIGTLGTFRPRKENGQELQIVTSAGTATAGRWIGAPVLITTS